MDEAQQLADRVVVLSNGRVLADAEPDQLGREETVVTFRVVPGLPLPAGTAVERGIARLASARPTHDLAPLLAWAAAHDIELDGLTVTRPSLEDVYLELTA